MEKLVGQNKFSGYFRFVVSRGFAQKLRVLKLRAEKSCKRVSVGFIFFPNFF